MESLPPVRRVVTDHNDDGIAVIRSVDHIFSQVQTALSISSF